MKRHVAGLAVIGLLLATSAPVAAAPRGSTPRPFFGENYSLEVTYTFHAALLHWLDSLAGLDGNGLTAGKTESAHRGAFIERWGRPDRSDIDALTEFARIRVGYAKARERHSPNALTVAFFEAADLDDALSRAGKLLKEEDVAALHGAMSHFSGRFREIWRNGRIPHRFVRRSRSDPALSAIEQFLVRVADFYDVSAQDRPAPRLVLTNVPAGAGTHAQAIDRFLLIELRDWEALLDEVGPIVHENAHFLFYRIPQARRDVLARIAHSSGPNGAVAWQLLHEALPTAIAQGAATRRFTPERFDFDSPWYHLEQIDRYAKALLPLVQLTLARGGKFDESFVRAAVAALPPTG